MSNTMKLGAVVVIAAAIAGGIYLLRSDPGPAPKKAPAQPEGPGAILEGDERREYCKQFVEIIDLKIDPDTKPNDPDSGVQFVPGLLRAHGSVQNKGDKRVNEVNVVVHMKGADGAVLGTFVEDVAGGRVLGPNELRTFKFEIPDKKEYSGEFSHSVR